MAHATDNKNKPARPDLREIAIVGGDLDLSGYLGEIIRPGDTLLNSLGGDLKHYESLLRDDQVHSTFQQRRRAVISEEWEVEPGGNSALDKAAAEDLKEQLDHIRFNNVTDKMLYGVFYGYAIGECMWKMDGNRVLLDAVKVRKASRFMFGKDGSLRLRGRGEPVGWIMPERKFWTFSTGADNDDDPYGRGLGFWLYWPVFLKRNGVKFWAIALEKFGMPTSKGTYPIGASEDERKALLQAVAAVGTDAAIIMPEGMDVAIIEAARRSGGDYSVFARYFDASISKVVLSQTMTTDAGSSRAQSDTHMDVRQDVVKSDADLSCESFNRGPARWLTEWNFPGAATPEVRRIIEEPEDLKATSERDRTVYEMGFNPSEDYIRDKYGEGWSKKADRGNPSGEDTRFAESTDPLEALLDGLIANNTLGEAMDPVFAPIEDLLAGSASYEEFTAGLAGLIKEMDSEKMTDLLARSTFAIRLFGETGQEIEGDG